MEQIYPNMTSTVSTTPYSFWRGGQTADQNPCPIQKYVTEEGTLSTKEYTGGSVSYYRVHIKQPTSGGLEYLAECNDIIEALGMNYAEGNAFKAIWRSCAARNLGLSKDGYKDGVYDAEKVVFFGTRMVEQAKNV